MELDQQGRGTEGKEQSIVAPGLIDLHVHGFGGSDAIDDVAGMAWALAAGGTTAFQPTLFPEPAPALGRCAASIWSGGSALTSVQGARVLGLHLEGPFVNPESAGALPREALAMPSLAALRAILGPATGDGRGIRTMTIAPELAGARELIDELVRCGIVPSLGHSRATTREAGEAVRSVRAKNAPSDRPERLGATHLYNAMPRFHHRDAGLAGFALTGGVSYAEIIGDLAHVGAEAIELALRALGPKALCLVSDALPGAGTGCDVFHWRGREHRVRDGAAYWETPGGEALAGSATSQLDAVRKLVRAGVVTLEEALTMASEAPARALGMENEIGRLVPGARADFIVLGPDLELLEVWIGGRRLVPDSEGADR